MINLKDLIKEVLDDKKVKLSSKVYVAKEKEKNNFDFYEIKEVCIGKNGEIFLFADFYE